MSDDDLQDDGFTFDLSGDAVFLHKFGKAELEELQTFIAGMVDDRALDRHFNKRVKEEIRLFWSEVDLDFYGETAVVFPHSDHDYIEPLKFDFYETFVRGLESTAEEDLPQTEALLLKCLDAVRAAMKGSAR